MHKYSDFPDYQTILTIVRETNNDANLRLTDEGVSQLGNNIL